MEFSQYKSNAMKKLEYALSEGLVDEGVISVINSFNSHPDIFTTSSCAGRIQLIILPDIGRKDSVQRRKTWHREVTAEEVDEAITEFEIAEKMAPDHCADTILRYNSCLRTIKKENLQPRQEFDELY